MTYPAGGRGVPGSKWTPPQCPVSFGRIFRLRLETDHWRLSQSPVTSCEPLVSVDWLLVTVSAQWAVGSLHRAPDR